MPRKWSGSMIYNLKKWVQYYTASCKPSYKLKIRKIKFSLFLFLADQPPRLQ